MEIGEKLRDFYYAGEEKWYGFLDRLDEHIPIYKVIDPIDDVVPSFALFVVLAIILLLLLGLFLVGTVFTQNIATLKLMVSDEAGNAVEGATIILSGPVSLENTSNAYGLLPDVALPLNSTVKIVVSKEGVTTVKEIYISEMLMQEEIILPVKSISFEPKAIKLLTPTGSLATDQITLTFSCSNPEATPPEEVTTSTGIVNVNSPSDCGTLQATIKSDKYEAGPYSITSTILYLKELVVKGARVTVNLKYNGKLIAESVPVEAYRANNIYSPIDTERSYNGQAIFDLPEGGYYFQSKTTSIYKSGRSDTIQASADKVNSVEIELDKNIVGTIKVNVKKDGLVASGVYVSIRKGMSEVNNDETDSNGSVAFDVAEEGPYRVMASLDGYCTATATDVAVGATVDLVLVGSTGTCGSILIARVTDSEGRKVPYAKVVLFGENDAGVYKLGYAERVTDFNGEARWGTIPDSTENIRVFAYKSSYNGWSEARVFNSGNADIPFEVTLEIPYGTVNVSVKDRDGNPLQYATVTLYDDYSQGNVIGTRIVEDVTGVVSLKVKADKKVYAVVSKDSEEANDLGYETVTTVPKQVTGNGTITFDVVLPRPPQDKIKVDFLGLYKGDLKALKVEAAQEYDAIFAVTAPLDYDNLGLFVRVGKDNVTKTELDKLYIKDVEAPRIHTITKGSSYNPPKGGETDSQYLNLEESKWAQVTWAEGSYNPGKIMVKVKIKIRDGAQMGDDLVIAYRAFGVLSGSYNRDPLDDALGTAESSSAKSPLYAECSEELLKVGEESLCEVTDSGRTFCVTSNYIDAKENFIHYFDTSFDAKNNETYYLGVKVLNGSSRPQDIYEKAKTKFQNTEENVYMENYTLLTPTSINSNGSINGFEGEWIDTSNFEQGTSINLNSMTLKPQKSGTGTILMRIRDGNELIFEKPFVLNIAATEKLRIEFMVNGEFQAEMPKLLPGKDENITVKVFNAGTNLEVSGAIVKIFDRFGTKLSEKTTNTIGIATVILPAGMPGEKMKLVVEKGGYETLEFPFNISDEVVDVTPADLTFTLNPQTTPEESKTVKIENKTGIDLEIREIILTGKFKGLLDEARIASWFETMKGKIIKAQDYEEIDFKVIIAKVIPQADDLEGTFQIVVGSEEREWVKEVKAKIRVGVGNDVDDPNCLSLTATNWVASTEGKEIEFSFNIKNDCLVSGKLVPIRNLGARLETTGNNLGEFTVQSRATAVSLSKAYSRIFRPTVSEGETIPVTVKFAPYAGINGTTSGTITFEALNKTDSKDQKLVAALNFTINVVNLQECIVIGADLITVPVGGQQGFSIANNCPDKVDIQVQTDLQVSQDKFSIATGGSEEVVVSRTEGDVPGAYNILVYGRQKGMPLRLIGNVKAILEAEGCFQLSRYEYDVYDSPFNDKKGTADGIDRGFLKNVCTQKSVSVEISGTEPVNWKKILLDALIGGISGYTKGGIWGDNNNWPHKDNPDVSKNINDDFKELAGMRSTAATNLTQPIKQNFAEITTAKDNMITQLKSEETACNTRADASAKEYCISNCPAETAASALTDCQKEVGTQLQSFCEKTYDGAMKDIKKYYDPLAKVQSEGDKDFQKTVKAEATADATLKKDLQAKATKGVSNEEVEKAIKDRRDKIEKELNDKAKEITDEYNKQRQETVNGLKEVQQKLINLRDTGQEVSVNAPAGCKGSVTLYLAAENTAPKIAPSVKTSITIKMLTNIGIQGKNKIDNTVIPDNPVIFTKQTLSPNMKLNTSASDAKSATSTSKAYSSTSTSNAKSATSTSKAYSSTSTSKAYSSTSTSKAYSSTSTSNAKSATTETKAYGGNPKGAEFILATSTGTINPVTTLANAASTVNSVTSATTSQPYNSFGGVGNPGFANNYYGSGTNQDVGSTSMCGGSSADRTSSFMDKAGGVITDWGIGLMGGNAIFGALLAGLFSWFQQSDQDVCYTKTFAVPLVEITDVALSAPDGKSGVKGISMSVGDPTFDYDSSVQPNTLGTGSQGGTSMGGAGYFYNPQTLSASIGLAEIRELTFTNTGKVVQDNEFKKIEGLLKVSGIENLYKEKYGYQKLMEKLEERNEADEDNEERGWLDSVFGSKWDADISDMTKEDLEVTENRNYEKQFHLLFDSWEYVECGPNTYPCPAPVISNCTVGSKAGSTGDGAIPKIKLEWGWDKIGATECDGTSEEDTDASGYVYCDTTQFTIATLKKLKEIKDFISTSNITKCPKAIDVAGTKTQELSRTGLDVGITMIRMSEDADKATIEVKVSSNNQQTMNGKVKIIVGGDANADASCEETKEILSEAYFKCDVSKATLGTGTFPVKATLMPALCSGCENNDTSNDTITSQLILGSTGLGECQSYDTKKDNFSRILAANGLLEGEGETILNYVNFTASIVKDGFSDDFKKDFDETKFLNAPTWFADDGLESLFLSSKFKVSPQSWTAGKYTATIVVTFNENKFEWKNDNNNIKSVEIRLEPWSEPKPASALYDFAFDGTIGLDSDNGRQGYGSSYEQTSEQSFIIGEEGGSAIYAETNPSSNAISNVTVSVDNSPNVFYNLNVGNRGNVLTISGAGDNIGLAMTPSVPVPLILNITRENGSDAYGFYSVQVDGQPQNTGPYMMYWNGIGGGCVDFTGMPMSEWQSTDSPADQSPVGDKGMANAYGLGWANVTEKGTASFYGVMYVPQGRTSIISVQGGDSANMESPYGNGNQISVTASAGIKSLKDVLDMVKQEKICVIGTGDYFWNNKPFLDPMGIEGKASGCISS